MKDKIDVRIVIVAFFAAAIAIRFLPHFYNMAPIGALAIFAGCYWSPRVGLLLAMCAMAISDALGQWFQVPSMGFYDWRLMLAVYLGMGLMAYVGWGLRGRVNPATVPLAAIAGTVVFYVVSNFAVWLAPDGMYARSLSGFLKCYWNAIPFAWNSLIGNLLYTSLFFSIYTWVLAPRFNHETQATVQDK